MITIEGVLDNEDLELFGPMEYSITIDDNQLQTDAELKKLVKARLNSIVEAASEIDNAFYPAIKSEDDNQDDD